MIKTELSPQINVLATVMIVITVGLPVIAHYVLRKK
jgi:ABC-type spermidine/putrescine transport system permease subunit II